MYVVVQSAPSQAPIAYLVEPNVVARQVDHVPFPSELLRRFRARRRAAVVRWVQGIAQGLVVLLSISVACLTFFGVVQLRVVLSGSMSGTFDKGDVVISVNPALVEPAVGDIAIFHYYNLDRTEKIADFSHRIVGGNSQSGWKTKGDANDEPELSPVLADDVVGVVVGWVPWVGNLLQPNTMILVVALVFAAYVGGPEIRDQIRSRKKR